MPSNTLGDLPSHGRYTHLAGHLHLSDYKISLYWFSVRPKEEKRGKTPNMGDSAAKGIEFRKLPPAMEAGAPSPATSNGSTWGAPVSNVSSSFSRPVFDRVAGKHQGGNR
jgi:hypothetical protein